MTLAVYDGSEHQPQHQEHQFHGDAYDNLDPAQLGQNLYLAASAVSSSSSSQYSSDEPESPESCDDKKRKRKRSE